MSPKLVWTVSALAGIVLITGCKGSSDDLAQGSQPKPVVFEGSVDPKYVGVWKGVNGLTTMDLHKDGSMKIETISESRNGKNDLTVTGQWKVSGPNLLFDYSAKGKGSTILKYSAVLAGKTLTLQQKGMRLKMVYKRK